jgi:hypothetical protein
MSIFCSWKKTKLWHIDNGKKSIAQGSVCQVAEGGDDGVGEGYCQTRRQRQHTPACDEPYVRFNLRELIELHEQHARHGKQD